LFGNVDEILIRTGSIMYIDDVRMSNMMTEKVFNLGFGSAGGIISEHRFFESPSKSLGSVSLGISNILQGVERRYAAFGENGINPLDEMN